MMSHHIFCTNKPNSSISVSLVTSSSTLKQGTSGNDQIQKEPQPQVPCNGFESGVNPDSSKMKDHIKNGRVDRDGIPSVNPMTNSELK